MNVDVGFYKIKSRSRRKSNQFHYLRVYIKNKKKYIQIDAYPPQEVNDDMYAMLERFELLKKITIHNPVEFNNTVLKISWLDEDNDDFTVKSRNIHNFKRTLALFPRLKKALSFNK